MRFGVLNTEDLAILRTQALLAEVPVMDWVRIDNHAEPLVAAYEWLMPLECYVAMSFWLMSGAKVFRKNLNTPQINEILENLNSRTAFFRKESDVGCLEYMASVIQCSLQKQNALDKNKIYQNLEYMLTEATNSGYKPVMA